MAQPSIPCSPPVLMQPFLTPRPPAPDALQGDARMRVIYFARPKDPAAQPKAGSAWHSGPPALGPGAAELPLEERVQRSLSLAPPADGLREWAQYLADGGRVLPLELLQDEGEGPCEALRQRPGPRDAAAFCPLTARTRHQIAEGTRRGFVAALEAKGASAEALHKALESLFGVERQVRLRRRPRDASRSRASGAWGMGRMGRGGCGAGARAAEGPGGRGGGGGGSRDEGTHRRGLGGGRAGGGCRWRRGHAAECGHCADRRGCAVPAGRGAATPPARERGLRPP